MTQHFKSFTDSNPLSITMIFDCFFAVFTGARKSHFTPSGVR